MSNNNNPELRNWFDDALKQGHTIDELIPHLKEHGYTDEMITPVVDELKAELQNSSQVSQAIEEEYPSNNQEEATATQNIYTQESSESPNTQDSIAPESQTPKFEPENLIDESEDLDLEPETEPEFNLEDTNSIDEDENQHLDQDESFNPNIESFQETQEDEYQELEQDTQDDSNEMSLEEIEQELSAQPDSYTNKSTSNFVKPVITIVILLGILLAGYAIYPQVSDFISNFQGSTPKAAPPTLPGNSFDLPTPQTQTDFVEESQSNATLLQNSNDSTQQENIPDENANGLRRFNKDLYFK